MFLIVGLGNIGVKYKHTRHNIGFDFIDLVSKKYNIPLNREKFKGIYGEGIIEGNKVILLKPSTYMNLSGESVREAVDFYKIKTDHIIIVYDDINIDIGRFRIRTHGSAGGHNGIKNIILNLGTDMFPRIKIGVGQPDTGLVSYVLGRFSEGDRLNMEKVLEIVLEALECIMNLDIEIAMNKFNGFKL
ncbi:aminoacyl-tRNA hydrolase [Clostridium sp. WILCCON 0269]|uniref:Peptidyl-tRNA hydrolase n=1 Tax=Candidatus Clostridium eludens TaxID=3381663 RepID=A0ABW8SGN0_9CLOT